MEINIKNYIKSLLALKCITITKMAKMMSEKTGKKYTFRGLSQKLARESFSLKETFILAELIGYEVKIVEKN